MMRGARIPATREPIGRHYSREIAMRTSTEKPPEVVKTEVAASPERGSRNRPAFIFGPHSIATKGWNAARLALAGFWLLMAGYNLAVLLPAGEEAYQGIADISWPGFDWIVTTIVQPIAVPFTIALIVWEIGIAALVASKGTLVKVGLLAALVQVIALAPFMSWYELANIPVAIWIWLLLQRDYDRSVLDMVRR
jgi:hypothetical protein